MSPASESPRVPVFFASLRGYQGQWLRRDLIAGLTVWAVMVPEAFAYATIAGVPPVVGLYAAVPALIAYAAFGSSRHLVVGPMSATAALSAATIAEFAPGNSDAYIVLTTVLAIVTGVVAIVAGLARLGFVATFISEPVLKGFIVGLALTIIIGQLPKLFGVEGGGEGAIGKFVHVLGGLGQLSVLTTVIGVLSLVVVLALKRWLPAVPASLAVVLLGIVVVHVFGLSDRLDVVGEIDPGLPTLGLPSTAWGDYAQLAGPAVGVMLIAFAEGLGAAKTYAARNGYEVDANRELIGLGAANLGSGLASGMVVNGSLSKTAVNGSAGARSQVSGLVVAALSLITLLFLTALFEELPEAVLAAVVISAVVEMVDTKAIMRFYRVWTPRLGGTYGRAARADFIGALAALIGVLVFDTLPGLIIGIVTSLLLMLYRTSRPSVRTLTEVDGNWLDAEANADHPVDPAVLVVRVESGLFFANADHVKDEVRRRCTPQTRLVVLDAQTTPFIDISGATALAELKQTLERGRIALVIAGNIGQVRDVLSADHVGGPKAYATVAEAIGAFQAGADDESATSSPEQVEP
ncbi:SulP family inorganic anion transporter [Occultella aeris]|uniref:Putative sulfate transporter/MT1781 n=1 Tax=Occultella aeris TaxID=2761496 RepID=A0A7M4DQJ3_9MICO|nr:SulP family inorganic anion transporter [Occultella aeris]VZO39737.1 putative sulfate transporter/MT1781 [Occultella aeris]